MKIKFRQWTEGVDFSLHTEDITYALVSRNILLQNGQNNLKISISGKSDFVYCCCRIQKYCVYLATYSINNYAHISLWVGHSSICRDAQEFLSQSQIVSVLTDICKRSLEEHFLVLNVNVIVIIDIDLKELVRKIIDYPELRWVVIGFCGVVMSTNIEDLV